MLSKIYDFVFLTAYAQGTTPTGGSGSGGTGLNFDIFKFRTTSENDSSTLFNTIVNNVMEWVLIIIALIAFIYLILNGVKYITAGGDAAKATEARTGIINAIIGIVIVILAYVILKFAANLGKEIV